MRPVLAGPSWSAEIDRLVRKEVLGHKIHEEKPRESLRAISMIEKRGHGRTKQWLRLACQTASGYLIGGH